MAGSPTRNSKPFAIPLTTQQSAGLPYGLKAEPLVDKELIPRLPDTQSKTSLIENTRLTLQDNPLVYGFVVPETIL